MDGVWLAFGVKGLIEEWQRPDADRAACILKLTKIGVSAFGVAASLDTTLTKFDPWKNGVNFLVTAGDMIHEDKLSDWTRLVPTNDEHLELMNQLIKVAGVAIDPIATEQKSFRPSIPVGKVELITSARKRL